MRTLGILDPQWKYLNSQATRKPGYLARRFAAIRSQYATDWDAAHAENVERDAVPAKVTTMRKGAR